MPMVDFFGQPARYMSILAPCLLYIQSKYVQTQAVRFSLTRVREAPWTHTIRQTLGNHPFLTPAKANTREVHKPHRHSASRLENLPWNELVGKDVHGVDGLQVIENIYFHESRIIKTTQPGGSYPECQMVLG